MGRIGVSIMVILFLAAIGLALYACHQAYFA